MKLIRNFDRVEDADEASMLLASRGIVTHISSRNTKLLATGFLWFIKIGLWAVLEHQHQDAQKLLDDDQHVVSTGISSQQMQTFSEVAGERVFQMLNKALYVGIALIVVMIVVIYQLNTNR